MPGSNTGRRLPACRKKEDRKRKLKEMRYFIIDVKVMQAIRHSCKIIRKNQPIAKMILKELRAGEPDQYPVYRNAWGSVSVVPEHKKMSL